jgi:hypothetical protein
MKKEIKILRLDDQENREWKFEDFLRSDVVISDGVVIKDREGKGVGKRIDSAVYIWDETGDRARIDGIGARS